MKKIKITKRQTETLIKVLNSTILKARVDIAMKTPKGRKIRGSRSLTPNYLSYCLDIIADLTPILMELRGGEKSETKQ